MCSISTGCGGFPGCSSVLLCMISLGYSRCGLIGCDVMFSRRSSIYCFAS